VQWKEETTQVLVEHVEKCARVAALVQAARFAMLDHDLQAVDARLAELERFFCGTLLETERQ